MRNESSMRYLKSFLKYFLYFYLGLTLIIWLAMPYVANYFINPVVSKYQLALADSTTIRYNLLSSTLTVTDLALYPLESEQSAAGEKTFGIDDIELELHLHQLFFKKIYIADFIIDGVFLDVQKRDDDLIVAGVNLSELPESTNAEPAAEEKPTELPSYLPDTVILPEFVFSNAKIDINIDDNPHLVQLSRIQLSDIEANIQQQNVNIVIESLLNEAAFNTNAVVAVNKGDLTVDVDVNLNAFDLAKFNHLLPENLKNLTGKLNYKANHNVTLTEKNITLATTGLAFGTENLSITQNNQQVSLAKQSLNSEQFVLEYGFDGEVSANGNADYSLLDIAVKHAETQQNVLNIHSVSLNDILINTVDEVPEVQIAQLTVVDTLLFDNKMQEQPAIVNLANLTSNKLSFSAQKAAIDSVTLSGLAVDVLIDENKQILNLVAFESDTENKAAESNVNDAETVDEPEEVVNQPVNTEEKAPLFAIEFGQFSLLEPADINFVDNSVSPKFEQNITVTELSIGALSSFNRNNVTPAKLVATSKQYLAIDLALNAIPLADIPKYELKGHINELNLPPISSYIKDALKYEIQSGQLDLAINSKITGTELGGDINVLMRGTELTKADAHEASVIKDSASVPFNVALGMLKDSDGNVDLSLPLSGDVSSPDFGLSGLITLLVKQATLSAAKDYLVNTFVPYASVVKIAVAAGEYALKINFNDLTYNAKQITFSEQQNEYIEQFAAVMKKEVSVAVKLCPVSTPADIGLPLGKKVTDKKVIEKMHEVSRARAEYFKKYMVEEKQVESSRLLLCTPQIDFDEEAKPFIKFVT